MLPGVDFVAEVGQALAELRIAADGCDDVAVVCLEQIVRITGDLRHLPGDEGVASLLRLAEDVRKGVHRFRLCEFVENAENAARVESAAEGDEDGAIADLIAHGGHERVFQSLLRGAACAGRLEAVTPIGGGGVSCALKLVDELVDRGALEHGDIAKDGRVAELCAVGDSTGEAGDGEGQARPREEGEMRRQREAAVGRGEMEDLWKS